MAPTTAGTPPAGLRGLLALARWRTIDIVVTSTIGAAFGVVFLAWNNVWAATEAAFGWFKPAQAIIYGIWLLPAVLAGVVVRKPGAALYCETVAAVVSALLGSVWGALVIPQGLLEGLGAELIFLVLLYRVYTLPVALAAGAAAGITATLFDAFYWYPTASWVTFRLPYMACAALSSVIVAGLGAWALTRALARTGVLDRFPAGRQRAEV